jgi:hypothetical protein
MVFVVIAGNTSSLTAHSPDYGFASSPPGVREATNTLVTAIQNTPAAPPPDPAIAKVLLHWLQQPSEQDEKCRKLQYEKDSLQLQVQVLTDQIEAQTDKIAELEKTLMEKKQLLSDNEDKFQREVLSRSSLETQKLELMSIMSELKLQQAALERENMELRSQFNNNGDVKKPPLVPRMSQTSTPVHHAGNQALRMSPSPSPVTMTGSSPRREQEVQAPKTPPANYKRQIDLHYGSLPRQQFISNGGGISTVDSNANPSKKGVAFGRGLSSLIGGRARGFSVPNLGDSSSRLGMTPY